MLKALYISALRLKKRLQNQNLIEMGRDGKYQLSNEKKKIGSPNRKCEVTNIKKTLELITSPFFKSVKK